MPTDGTDVKVKGMEGTCALHLYKFLLPSKVYAVGPDYAHAEARKSPALDGKVERDSEGKEIRYPVILTNREKTFARKIVWMFRVSSKFRIADGTLLQLIFFPANCMRIRFTSS